MGLTKENLKKVEDSNTIIGMLADAFKRDTQTIQRWVAKNSEMLTTVKALEIISTETGVPPGDLVEKFDIKK